MGSMPDQPQLNVLSLFAGIGGLELGLERAGMRTVGQVEIDPYCCRVLAKHWPDIPRHDDVRTAAEWWLSTERPTVDVICGGFPCQDISAAGRRAGIIDGERSSLWTYFAHTIRELRPRYVLVENVARVLVRGADGVVPLDVIAGDLAEIGYDLRWDCVPAAAVGAPHQRDRWVGIAYPQRDTVRVEPVPEPGCGGAALARLDGPERTLAHAASSSRPDEQESDRGRQPIRPISSAGSRVGSRDSATRDHRHGAGPAVLAAHVAHAESITEREPSATADAVPVGGYAWPVPGSRGEPGRPGWWSVEPDVGRVANGIPHRVDRLRALGNAVVPQVAEHVGRLIMAHAEAAVVGAAVSIGQDEPK